MNIQEIEKYDGNYSEDFEHENGNYINKCKNCDNQFLGHKRRTRCKKCVEDLKNKLGEELGKLKIEYRHWKPI